MLNTAVIGTGYLGSYHAEKLHEIPESKLVAVCDLDEAKGQKVAQKFGTLFVKNYSELLHNKVDAVTIAATTKAHYEIARFFLENNVHVFVEKPITTNLAQAKKIISIANKKNLILQVGHIERFNKVITSATSLIDNPRFIECLRLSPFRVRCTDVNVILDLMIHDLDILQFLVNSKIKNIFANGTAVFSSCIDIASARIEFENGCVSNVTASRVSESIERKIHVFQHDCYIGLDLNKQRYEIKKKIQKNKSKKTFEIQEHTESFEKTDALKEEIKAFINSILTNTPAKVTGKDGLIALERAIKITEIVKANNND